MKNVKNIFHNSSTFVVPVSAMRDDVPKLGVALLDDLCIEERILIVEGCAEIDFAVGENERLGEFFCEETGDGLVIELFQVLRILYREFELGEFDGAIEMAFG